MKYVYVCGDSFGSIDPEYGTLSWTEILAQKLPDNMQLVNLSKVCASNLHIALQVDRAIESRAYFIIYLATTSTRYNVEIRPTQHYDKLLDRFVDITLLSNLADLTSYSSRSLDSTTQFNNQQLEILRTYHSEFSNLDLDIYQNELVIHATLSKLVESNCKFLFDQGGFEHPSFGSNQKDYFKNYQSYRSTINIWDYVIGQKIFHRPYYHIRDQDVHQSIADYYYTNIIQYL